MNPEENPDTDIEATLVKTRAAQTRCYVTDTGYVLRSKGRLDSIVNVPNLGADVKNSMVVEMIALLLLRGASMDMIVAGKGLPDRALPAGKREKSSAPKALNMVQRAILAVRVAELIKSGKADGAKPDKAAIAADSEAFVRQLTKEQTARHARALPVRIELERLRGGPATLDEAAGDPPAAA